LLNRVREVIADQALEYTASRVRVELARFGMDEVAMGASTLVIDALLNNGAVPLANGAVRLLPAVLP
jgi:hypothetical protein